MKPSFNTLRPGKCGRHSADDIIKCISLKKNFPISNRISLKCVSTIHYLALTKTLCFFIVTGYIYIYIYIYMCALYIIFWPFEFGYIHVSFYIYIYSIKLQWMQHDKHLKEPSFFALPICPPEVSLIFVVFILNDRFTCEISLVATHMAPMLPMVCSSNRDESWSVRCCVSPVVNI